MNPATETPPEVVQPSALEAISRAEINQCIATARQFPRVLSTVRQQMMNFATLDTETAASCFYKLPRGGKVIEGPSIRLAEIAISCYTNIQVGSRILVSDTESAHPHVVVQAIAIDLQNNVRFSIEKRRRIIGKKSRGGIIDEDDINLSVNACSAIAIRDVAFKVIPMALIKPVFLQAKKIATGDAKTLVERRGNAIEAFSKMGIQQDRILTKLEKKSVEDIGLEDLETLIGLFTAIKEGECTIDEAFPTVQKEDKGAAIPEAKTPTGQTQPKDPAKQTETPKTPADGSASAQTAKAEEKPAATTQEAATPQKTEAQAATKAPEQPPVSTPETLAKPGETPTQTIGRLLTESEITPETFIAHLRRIGLAKKDQKWTELAEAKLTTIISKWTTLVPEIKKTVAAAN